MKNNNIFSLRTDLIIDNPNLNGETITYNGIDVTTVNSCGNYITITLYDDNEEIINNSIKIISKEIKKLLDKNNINDTDECIIIGLGNKKSTPDSLGPRVIDKIFVTRHLFMLGNINSNYRCVSAFSPGVMGDTGIETYDIIVSLVKKINPKFIIVIDALASSSIDRINHTIQITDTGIHPGSGVGNNRQEISKKTLNIPVLAIGVPTVVSSAVIAYDTFNYMLKHLSYIKDNSNKYKLTFKAFGKYKDKIKDKKLNDIEKNKLVGIFGTLSDGEQYDLFREVLDSINENLIVTSTEVDFIMNKLSDLISSSLNNALHRQISCD